MLTRNFAAGTTALGCEGGEIDFHLVGVLAASLTFAPECLAVLSKLGPGRGDGELPGILGRTGVRG